MNAVRSFWVCFLMLAVLSIAGDLAAADLSRIWDLSDTNINANTGLYSNSQDIMWPTGEKQTATVTIGSGTSSTDTSTASPINISYRSLHGQSVYTAAELNAAGLVGPATITELGFNVTGLPNRAMPDYIVRMAHTSATNASSWIQANLQTVYTASSYQPTATGWNMFSLSTPFLWNGVDNIVVDSAFGRFSGRIRNSGTVQYTNVSNGYRYVVDNGSDQTNIFTGGKTNTYRPNLKIAYSPPNPATVSSPAHQATGIQIDVTLSWNSGGGAPTGYKLYFGTDNPPSNIINGDNLGDVLTYDPGTLSPNTTYYWQVVPYNDNGDATGCPIWSFTTIHSNTEFPWLEGFESYDDFALEFTPWTQYDGDGSSTYSIQDYTFENQGYTGSYIIMNPSSVTPFLSNGLAYGGDKYAACFAAVNPPNNDWLISAPIEAVSGLRLSFWARSFNASYGLERFNVLVSNTTADPTAFTPISGDSYIEAPTEWTNYIYHLEYPGETIYVAIQCVSDDAFIFMVDDVSIFEAPPVPLLSINPETHDYGEIELMNPAHQDFTLSNTGSGTITINSGDIYISDDAEGNFTVQAENLPASLEGGNGYTFSVQFAPQSLGDKTATLNVQDNITRELHTINLTGKAVAEPAVSIINLQAELEAPNDARLNWSSIFGDLGNPGYLHWDNGTAHVGIGAGANSYSMVTKFGTDIISEYAGMELTEILFHIYANPELVDAVTVWTGSDDVLAPTTQLISELVSGLSTGWNSVPLSSPVSISGTDAIYVGYHISGTEETYPATVDNMPAVEGYGNLILWNSSGSWDTLTSSNIDGNWLIRAQFENSSSQLRKNTVTLQSTPLSGIHDGGQSLSTRTEKGKFRAISGFNSPNTLQSTLISAKVLSDGQSLDTPEEQSKAKTLRGFNIYRDGAKINSEFVNARTYLDENLAAGTYSYKVEAVYYTGSSISGSVSIEIPDAPDPYDLPFTEDWAGGDFDTNRWIADGENWGVNNSTGNSAPSASFEDDIRVYNYSNSLTSWRFDATEINKIQFSFDLYLDNFSTNYENVMTWEVWDGSAWNSLGSYSSTSGSLDWTNYSYDISEYASHRCFKIRFVASGDDNYGIYSWHIDNIKLDVVYDYHDDVPADVAGDNSITISGGNGIIQTGALTPVPDPDFAATFEQRIKLTGDGPWTVSVNTTNSWVVYLIDQEWRVATKENGVASFTVSGQSKSRILELKTGESDQSPTLPVELSAFNAQLYQNNVIKLQWQTQSETNVLGFGLYRGISDDLQAALRLDVMIPATNTSQPKSYLYYDREIREPGLYYYWLESTDLDGSSQFFGPVNIQYEGAESPQVNVTAIPGFKDSYPNPFNPTTTIRFGMDSPGSVEIRIYNQRGQLVRKLMDEEKSEGWHQVKWNGSGDRGQKLGSGVYLAVMEYGGRRYQHKMLMMK